MDDFLSNRAQLEQIEALERRRLRIAQQTSSEHSASERIRIWEELHALQLPLDATHPLFAVIARDTQLTLQQVKDEQLQRSVGSTAKLAPQRAKESWNPYSGMPRKAR